MFITFMQNDDWVYYRMLQSFLSGNFNLDPISAPTFYTQGILAFLFAKLFGVNNLPILTLFVSLLSYVLFFIIIRKFYVKSMVSSFLVSLLLLFNPWFLYSAIGFMTENYFLLFILIATYLFHEFDLKVTLAKESIYTKLVFTLVAILLAFMSRQIGLVLPITMALYYLLKKRYKLSIVFGTYFALLFGFYSFIFPKTAEMFEKPLQLHHLVDFDYTFSLVYASFTLLCALLLPTIIIVLKKHIVALPARKLLIFIVVSTVSYFILNKLFKPETVSWGEFPYLENVWERYGLYPRGVLGTKYQFRWNYDLYYYWDLVSKVLVSLTVPYLISRFRKYKLVDFNLLFILVYFCVMVLTETFYDRYLLIVLPFVILFLIKSIAFEKLDKLILTGYLMFLVVYSYQFTMDFMLVNKYIWDRSEQIVESTNINPNQIQGTNAWKLNYRNTTGYYVYDFSYDSPDVNTVYKENYTLLETKVIDYPFNIFIEPKIYLYQRK